MAANLYLRAPGEKRRRLPASATLIHLDEPKTPGYPLHHELAQLPGTPYRPGEPAQGFLLIALGVWAADKLLPRREARDAWTRRISLNLPVPEAWSPQAADLARLLNFLTGDDWDLRPRPARIDLGFKGEWPHPWQPQAVMLFSGGLDSLVGAIDMLEAGSRLLLVSHYDFGQLASLQQGLAAALTAHYGPEKVQHLGIRVQCPEAPELTLRSRSLLFLGLGLNAAAAFGESTPLIVTAGSASTPPLTSNRLGAYSTRTTHPHFLAQLASLWQLAGIQHPLANPYQDRTKGEMLQDCKNPDLLKELFARTVSCSRPVVARWRRRPAGSCGYCYPCLMRRAALNHLGWDDGSHYLLDVLATPETLRHRTRGGDLRALLLAVRTWEESPAEIQSRLWLGDNPGEVAARSEPVRAVLAKGFQEIGAFFKEKGPEWVKVYAGW